MKKLSILLLFPFTLNAVELKFIGPCEESFIMKTEVKEAYQTVGELTIATLKKYKIPYIGSEEGLASAFETPTGDASVEVISDVEMRAYGWCFSVDGVAPESYPHEVPITSKTRSVVWHYGFARFYRGQWVTQCTPAWKVKPDFLCKDSTPETER